MIFVVLQNRRDQPMSRDFYRGQLSGMNIPMNTSSPDNQPIGLYTHRLWHTAWLDSTTTKIFHRKYTNLATHKK